MRNYNLVVKNPATLVDAVKAFETDVVKRGFRVVGEAHAYWQGDLFARNLDAYVYGKIEQKREEAGKGLRA